MKSSENDLQSNCVIDLLATFGEWEKSSYTANAARVIYVCM